MTTMQIFNFDQLEDAEEDSAQTNASSCVRASDTACSIAFSHAVSRRSCVNSKVRWLMFKAIQSELKTDDEITAAQWVLCHCHKQLPYDRNWWSRIERQVGQLSASNPEIEQQIQNLNTRLHSFVKQLINATASIKKYIEGIDPITNNLRKRDWNASTSLSEWISGDRGLLIKKLANNDSDVASVRQFLPECLCENNLKEALHNGGILLNCDQFPASCPRKIANSNDIPLNLVRPGAADTRMLDITLMDGSVLPVRRSRCALGIPAIFVSDPIMIPKICVYDFSNGLHLYIFYRGHKMGKRKRPRFHLAEKHHLHAEATLEGESLEAGASVDDPSFSWRNAKLNTGMEPPKNRISNLLTQLLPGFSVPENRKEDLESLTLTNKSRELRSGSSNNKFMQASIDLKQGLSYRSLTVNERGLQSQTSMMREDAESNEFNSLTSFDVALQSTRDEKPITTLPIQTTFSGPDDYTYILNANLVIEVDTTELEAPDVPPHDSCPSSNTNFQTSRYAVDFHHPKHPCQQRTDATSPSRHCNDSIHPNSVHIAGVSTETTTTSSQENIKHPPMKFSINDPSSLSVDDIDDELHHAPMTDMIGSNMSTDTNSSHQITIKSSEQTELRFDTCKIEFDRGELNVREIPHSLVSASLTNVSIVALKTE